MDDKNYASLKFMELVESTCDHGNRKHLDGITEVISDLINSGADQYWTESGSPTWDYCTKSTCTKPCGTEEKYRGYDWCWTKSGSPKWDYCITSTARRVHYNFILCFVFLGLIAFSNNL